MTSNKNANNGHIYFKGEKPSKRVEQSLFTRSMETDQIATAKIVRNSPLTQEFTPLGYNREAILDRVARADFWNFNVALNPNHVEEYSPTGHIDFEHFARSATTVNGTNSNMFIWDSIPELENFPVSGHPEEVSQQYVLYNVEPAWIAQPKKKLHIHAQAVPTAYGSKTNTSKSQTVVYQTPVTSVQEAISGTSIFKRLKTWLVGG